MEEYNNDEFNWIIQPIIDNKEYQKLKEVPHHGSTRYDHSMRVAYYTYLTAKFFHLDDYQATTKAALLHDFFIDEVKDKNMIARLRKHPAYAAENAKEHFGLNEKQVDIIKTHMFPITFTPPKYIEGWIVTLADKYVSLEVFSNPKSLPRYIGINLSKENITGKCKNLYKKTEQFISHMY